MRFGTLVVDEKPYPITGLALINGVVQVRVEIPIPEARPLWGTSPQYVVMGEDGTVVWMGRVVLPMFRHADIATDDDWYGLMLNLGVVDKKTTHESGATWENAT